eukprot:838535_1
MAGIFSRFDKSAEVANIQNEVGDGASNMDVSDVAGGICLEDVDGGLEDVANCFDIAEMFPTPARIVQQRVVEAERLMGRERRMPPRDTFDLSPPSPVSTEHSSLPIKQTKPGISPVKTPKVVSVSEPSNRPTHSVKTPPFEMKSSENARKPEVSVNDQSTENGKPIIEVEQCSMPDLIENQKTCADINCNSSPLSRRKISKTIEHSAISHPIEFDSGQKSTKFECHPSSGDVEVSETDNSMRENILNCEEKVKVFVDSTESDNTRGKPSILPEKSLETHSEVDVILQSVNCSLDSQEPSKLLSETPSSCSSKFPTIMNSNVTKQTDRIPRQSSQIRNVSADQLSSSIPKPATSNTSATSSKSATGNKSATSHKSATSNKSATSPKQTTSLLLATSPTSTVSSALATSPTSTTSPALATNPKPTASPALATSPKPAILKRTPLARVCQSISRKPGTSSAGKRLSAARKLNGRKRKRPLRKLSRLSAKKSTPSQSQSFPVSQNMTPGSMPRSPISSCMDDFVGTPPLPDMMFSSQLRFGAGGRVSSPINSRVSSQMRTNQDSLSPRGPLACLKSPETDKPKSTSQDLKSQNLSQASLPQHPISTGLQIQNSQSLSQQHTMSQVKPVRNHTSHSSPLSREKLASQHSETSSQHRLKPPISNESHSPDSHTSSAQVSNTPTHNRLHSIPLRHDPSNALTPSQPLSDPKTQTRDQPAMLSSQTSSQSHSISDTQNRLQTHSSKLSGQLIPQNSPLQSSVQEFPVVSGNSSPAAVAPTSQTSKSAPDSGVFPTPQRIKRKHINHRGSSQKKINSKTVFSPPITPIGPSRRKRAASTILEETPDCSHDATGCNRGATDCSRSETPIVRNRGRKRRAIVMDTPDVSNQTAGEARLSGHFLAPVSLQSPLGLPSCTTPHSSATTSIRKGLKKLRRRQLCLSSDKKKKKKRNMIEEGDEVKNDQKKKKKKKKRRAA